MGLLKGLYSVDLVRFMGLASLPVYFAIPIAVIQILLVITVANIVRQLLPKPKHQVPVAFHWIPWLGSAVDYGHRTYDFFEECRRKHGDVFSFILCGRTMTVFCGPAGQDFVLNAKVDAVSAEAAYSPLTTPVFGKGVVYDCPNHRLMEQKKFAKGALSRASFERYVPLIAKEVTEYFENSRHFKNHRSDKTSGVVDLMETNPELTIYTASRTLLGEECRKMFSSRTAKLYMDLDKAFNPLNFVCPGLPVPGNIARDQAQKEISQQYMSVIRRRREDNDVGSGDRDLIESLMVSATYKDGVKMSDQQIANLLIGVLMGGQHTSASISAWTMLHLGQNPHLIDELYEEQKNVVGMSDTPGVLNPIEYEHLQQMPLLNAVMKESLRLHEPLHSLFRKVLKDLPVPGTDYIIPRGHYILVSPGFTMVSEEYFENANEWNPKRWLAPGGPIKASKELDLDEKTIDYGFGEVSKGVRSPYLPFGGGRHRCIGEQFASVQLGTVLSMYIRRIKWTIVGDKLPPVNHESMVTLPEAPAKIQWVERS